jgi:WD40 repeat protein
VPGRRQVITVTKSAAQSWSIDAQDGAVQELVHERGTDSRFAGRVAVSPDGARAAIAFSTESVYVVDLPSRRLRARIENHEQDTEGGAPRLAFSPDGRLLAIAHFAPTVRLWDVEASRELLPPQGHADFVGRVASDPMGRRFASVDVSGRGCIWSADQGRLVRLIDGLSPMCAPAISEDGGRIAFVTPDWRFHVQDFATGTEVWNGAGAGELSALAFSPDGDLLITTGPGDYVSVRDAHTGRELERIHSRKHLDGAVAISRDGIIAAGTDDGGLMLWRRVPALPAKLVHELPASGRHDYHQVFQIRLSADGHRLGYVSTYGTAKIDGPFTQHFEACDIVLTPDSRDRLYASGDQRRAIAVPATGRGPTCVAFSADRRRMICGGADGLLRLWRVPPR